MPEMVHNIVYKFAQQIRGIYGDSLFVVCFYRKNFYAKCALFIIGLPIEKAGRRTK